MDECVTRTLLSVTKMSHTLRRADIVTALTYTRQKTEANRVYNIDLQYIIASSPFVYFLALYCSGVAEPLQNISWPHQYFGQRISFNCIVWSAQLYSKAARPFAMK